MNVPRDCRERAAATGGIAQAIGDILGKRGLRPHGDLARGIGDVADYDAVVLGSVVYTGRWLEPTKELVRRSGKFASCLQHRRAGERFAGNPQPEWGASLMDGDTRSSRLRGMFNVLLGAVIDLNGRPRYVHSGWFLISVANLIVIAAMIVVFALAILVPFPGGKESS